jgi:hypothetical protein
VVIERVWLSPTVGLIWRHKGDEDLTTLDHEPVGVAILPADAVELTIVNEVGNPWRDEALHERAVRHLDDERQA